MNSEITQKILIDDKPHQIRERFWQFVPSRSYSLFEARQLLHEYQKVVIRELRRNVKPYSIGYWLHLYRRVFPGPVGINKDSITIGITRSILEAAFQKFGQFDKCNRIGLSKESAIKNILGGILESPEFEIEKKSLLEGPNQLVLTAFSQNELVELYAIEKLAYEIWYIGATFRSFAKGAQFVVDDLDKSFVDIRTDEIAKLIEIYDSRVHSFSFFNVSSIGVVYKNLEKKSMITGYIFIPGYNVGQIKMDHFKDAFLNAFKINFPTNFIPNFLWIPFDLRNFRNTHLPMAEAFKKKHFVELDGVLAIIAAICYRAFYLWVYTKGTAIIRYWQRAYEGPSNIDDILYEIEHFLPAVSKILDIPLKNLKRLNLKKALKFWQLSKSNRDEIDIIYPGPHNIFIGFNERLFIDYCWIGRRMHDLFFGVHVEDQNFKGTVLEEFLGSKKSILPYKGCVSTTGEKRQIDYATVVNNHLIITECKVVSKSIGFHRGQPEAIKYRQKKVVDKSISEIDKKAEWPIKNPIGKNYNISTYVDILPLGISPFVEFIPSLNQKYWIKDRIPRVLTPPEFRDLIDNEQIIHEAWNKFPLKENT
jgi:hypothetical protein